MEGGDGGYTPSNIWQGGMAYVIIPPILWKVNILPYLYKYSDKINKFCFENGWFLMILGKFYQKFLPKCKILVSQAQRIVFFPIACSKFAPRLKVFTKLHDFSCRNTKFSSLWGGHIPPQTPPVRTSVQLALMRHQITPPCRRRIYAPGSRAIIYITESYEFSFFSFVSFLYLSSNL